MLESLLAGVRSACAAFPDKRRGNVTYTRVRGHETHTWNP